MFSSEKESSTLRAIVKRSCLVIIEAIEDNWWYVVAAGFEGWTYIDPNVSRVLSIIHNYTIRTILKLKIDFKKYFGLNFKNIIIHICTHQTAEKSMILKEKYKRWEEWRGNNAFLFDGNLMFGSDAR